MKNFNYHQPTRIVFGKGRIEETGEIVKEFGSRCLLVTTPAVDATEAQFERVKKITLASGVELAHFDQVIPNPTIETSAAGAAMAREHRADVIVGLGGGSIVRVLTKFFPKAKITGVDIDKSIVELGKRYFNLSSIKNLEIIISDASKFLKTQQKTYDLIFVDLYKGYSIPKKFQTDCFLKNLNKNLGKNGYVVFNMLAIQMKKPEAKSFLDKVEKIYHDGNTVSSFANTLVFARKK